MSKQAISLGRILGISIRLDYSWFVVFALMTWSLAVSYYPFQLRGLGTTVYWAMGAVTAIMLFGSVLLHELGHSVIALRYKIPVRSITLFIFGGVAEIGAEPPSASAEFFIAIAGPIVSFALAIFFNALQPIVAAIAPLLALAKYVALINGTLALFNLIPGFPLDGGRVFRAILWGTLHNLRRATSIAANLGRVIAFLFMAFGVWQAFLGNLDGLWFVFIGWYLQGAAESQLEQQQVASLLAGHPVSEAMNRSYVLVPAAMPLQQLVDQNLMSYGQRAFVVRPDSTVIGLLTWQDINAVPRAQWQTATAAQAMIPVGRLHLVGPDTALQIAADEIARDDVPSLPVISNGHILGTIGREELTWFLQRLRTLSRNAAA